MTYNGKGNDVDIKKELFWVIKELRVTKENILVASVITEKNVAGRLVAIDLEA